MDMRSVDAVMAIEVAAYAFPWTRGNFVDSLAAGYVAQLLVGEDGRLLGYFVALPGVEEMHLLNLCVAPAEHGKGHARFMLDALVGHCRARRASWLWLEVRESNARARRIYERYGFEHVGMRKGYYPAGPRRREDAHVMKLAIARGADGVD
jgi:ribosomal-protein-alanine N-acetyltransferase